MNATRRRKPRSMYSYTVEDDFICITDHDRGRSVTNDAKNVIADIVAAGIDVDAHWIIYRDTRGIWDWIRTKDGEFYGFESLNARSKQEAKGCLCARVRMQRTRGSGSS